MPYAYQEKMCFFLQIHPKRFVLAPHQNQKIPQVAIKDQSYPGKVCIGGVEKELQNGLLLGFAA